MVVAAAEVKAKPFPELIVKVPVADTELQMFPDVVTVKLKTPSTVEDPEIVKVFPLKAPEIPLGNPLTAAFVAPPPIV